jgi:hemerythrin-like domain-containing protein
MDQEDISKAKSIFEALKNVRSLVLEFYQVASEVEPEDKDFWKSLVYEEEARIRDIEKMSATIQEKPGNFEVGEPFRFDLCETATADIKRNIILLKNRELSKKDIFVIARNIEQSVLGTKYSEIVKTDDAEFLETAKEIISQTVIRKGRLNKKIGDLERGGGFDTKPKEAAKKAVIPDLAKQAAHEVKVLPKATQNFLKVNSQHTLFKEYLVLMQRTEGEINKHSVWMHLERIEKFMKRDISEHFKYEEEVVYKQILAENPDSALKRLVDELREEHKILVDILTQLEKTVAGEIFPLPKLKADELLLQMQEFSFISLAHLYKEEDRIMPLIK